MLTRQHFKTLASMVSKMENEKEKKELAENLAILCSNSNPLFDKAKFMKACGIVLILVMMYLPCSASMISCDTSLVSDATLWVTPSEPATVDYTANIATWSGNVSNPFRVILNYPLGHFIGNWVEPKIMVPSSFLSASSISFKLDSITRIYKKNKSWWVGIYYNEVWWKITNNDNGDTLSKYWHLYENESALILEWSVPNSSPPVPEPSTLALLIVAVTLYLLKT